MFDLFKKPVNIFCADMEELGRLLSWLRANSGLTYASHNTWEVFAIMPSVLNEDQTLQGFWVKVPYELAEPRIQKISEQDAFTDILSP